ncbi:tyrosine-type recombinase/integrase [Streptomyces sp. NPDC005962]|uniref:site-specific integrase n=1 Tax=Streptomyces sp. NPDC005962 TaxID=3154466 RepID=UPI0033E59539
MLTVSGGSLVWVGALSGTGAPQSGAVDRSGRRPRAASARPAQAGRLDAGEVTVQLQRIRRRLVHDETKTEASTAVLPLPDICVTALQVRRKEQEAAKQTAGELWTDSDFVFTTRYGTPIEPRNFNRSFADRSAKAGIRRIRLHDTRHTCGSLLAALDVHPRIAMQILRHSKIAVTMEIYTHVPSEATRKALRRLGKHLGKQDRK